MTVVKSAPDQDFRARSRRASDARTARQPAPLREKIDAARMAARTAPHRRPRHRVAP
jgi:hypothetical protein